MRIMIAVHGYPPTHTGGAEREAARVARSLAGRGHTVTVVAIESLRSEPPPISWVDAHEHGVLVRRVGIDLASLPDQAVSEFDNPLTAMAVAAALTEFQPDVFHLYSGYLHAAGALDAATMRGTPSVVSLMDYWWMCHRITLVRSDGSRCEGPSRAGCARCHAEQRRRFRIPARALPFAADAAWRLGVGRPAIAERLGVALQDARTTRLRAALHQADILISASQALATSYASWGVDPHKIHVNRQRLAIDRCILRQAADILRVGYIGQIKEHKGVHLLLEAWGRLHGDRPRRLTLYGSAAGAERYARRIRRSLQRLPHAEWAGEFSGDEVWRILADLDVLVVPSRWAENSPNVILEAQAVGVPVIGTNLGGVPEMVIHETNGLLFGVDDVADLARQLQRVLDDPGLLERLRLAPTPFETIDTEIDRLEALYRCAIAARRAGGAEAAAEPAPAEGRR